MSQFTEFCATRGQYKLRIYLKPEFAEFATGLTPKSGEPFVDRYTSPKLDARDGGKSQVGISRLVRVFLDGQFSGQWKTAFLYKRNEPKHLEKWTAQ